MSGRIALVIEAETSIARLMERILMLDGWSVIWCKQPAQALTYVGRPGVALVCCDYRGDADTGIIEALHASGLPLVLTSASPETSALAGRLGTPFLRQPFTVEDVESAVTQAILSADAHGGEHPVRPPRMTPASSGPL